MKISYYNFFLLFPVIAFLSCRTPQHMSRHAQIISNSHDSVRSLLIFPSCAHIQVIEEKNKLVGSEHFSREAENEIHDRLVEYIPSNLPKQFMQDDSLLKETVTHSALQLIKALKKNFDLKKAKVPEYLLQVLDVQNQDYGLLILQIGFTRTPDNYKKEYMRQRDLDWARLGIYTVYPNNSYSTMFGLLIDKKRKRVVKYKELKWRNKDPNDKYIIRSQVRDIILTSLVDN